MVRYPIGPLRGKSNRGKRVAYRSRTLAARRIQSAFRKKKQARFNFSKGQYRINKAVSKAMARMSETKLLNCANINAGALNGTPSKVIGEGSSAQVFAWRGCLQSVPSGWDPETSPSAGDGLQNLLGMTIPQGTGSTQHVGQYVYLKRTHLNLQLDMLMTTTNKPIHQFRFIIAKARQGVQPAGTTSYPQNTLFLNQLGVEQGHKSESSLAMNTFEVMNNPLNKRDWVILKDSRFFMASPVNIPALDGSTGVGYNQKYPSRKNFRINLPHFCKTKLSVSGTPVDYDAHYILYIYATAVGVTTNSILPDSFRVTARGTTSYTDN